MCTFDETGGESRTIEFVLISLLSDKCIQLWKAYKKCIVTGSAMDILHLQFKGPDTFNASVITLDRSFNPFTLSCFLIDSTLQPQKNQATEEENKEEETSR